MEIARLHHLADRSHGLLDRHVGVEPRGPVDVDVVRAQALKRVGQRCLDRLRSRCLAGDIASAGT